MKEHVRFEVGWEAQVMDHLSELGVLHIQAQANAVNRSCPRTESVKLIQVPHLIHVQVHTEVSS
jgi:hypothetical protein